VKTRNKITKDRLKRCKAEKPQHCLIPTSYLAEILHFVKSVNLVNSVKKTTNPSELNLLIKQQPKARQGRHTAAIHGWTTE
jgi:hypothetical protein